VDGLGARRVRSVTASVVAGFGLCLVALAALIATATRSAYRHQQDQAEDVLMAVAEAGSADVVTGTGAQPFLGRLAAEPDFAAFDPASCDRALTPLRTLVTEGAGATRGVVLGPDGAVVCSTDPDLGPELIPGEIAEALAAGTLEPDRVFVDPATGEPVVAVQAPIVAADGRRGALVGIVSTAQPLRLPPAVDPRTVLVAVDARRDVVIAASEGAPFTAGERVDDRLPRGHGMRSTDLDGVERIWHEHVDEATGWMVLAGLDVDVAFAAADDQRDALLLLGGGIAVLVVALAVLLQRRLARPIRRLGHAIAASRAGDRQARAPGQGPSEVVAVATAFNELVESQQALEGRLRHSARHDPLTGLLNRRELDARLARAVAAAREQGAAHAFLYVDLDQFKVLNDTCGHAAGDQLLYKLTAYLQSTLRKADVLARLGGDEFGVLAANVGDFFVTQGRLRVENSELKDSRLQMAGQLLQFQALQAENAHLRGLLKAQQRYPQRTLMAEILYSERDPFSRKIVIDRGSLHNISPGEAVADNLGVVGQVTRVYAVVSEVTLITDKDQAVPVQSLRNGLRAVVFGSGQDGTLNVPFMPINADIQPGDQFVTSGIDGIYPPGLPVAVVSKVERNAAYPFAKISCVPSAGVDKHRQVLVIANVAPPTPPKPQAGEESHGKR